MPSNTHKTKDLAKRTPQKQRLNLVIFVLLNPDLYVIAELLGYFDVK